MKYGKRILLMLMAACLIGTSASACEEASPVRVPGV